MNLFKTFGATDSDKLEDEVNTYCRANKVKIVGIQYAYDDGYYTLAAVFEPTDPSEFAGKTARQVELENEFNTEYRERVIKNGGITVTIAGKAGVGKTKIVDILAEFCHKAMIPIAAYEDTDARSMETRELVLIGKSQEELREISTALYGKRSKL